MSRPEARLKASQVGYAQLQKAVLHIGCLLQGL